MPERTPWTWYPLALGNAIYGPLLGLGALILLACLVRLRFLRHAESAWVMFADRTARFAGLLCFLTGSTVAAGIALCLRRPLPQVHDEASYLLAADTFAHGRWTNPALPADIRAHFEALHILVAPSYMSKYPPGQGLMLAVGQLLGDPIYSLWLSAGLAAAACGWMLGAFLPRRWAYLGGLLCALHPLVLKWSQSYWGGDVALIGGFLLWGAAGRLVGERWPSFRPPIRPPLPPNDGGSCCSEFADGPVSSVLPPSLGGRGGRIGGRNEGFQTALSLSVGLALLANSRPYEGVCVAALVSIPLIPAAARGLSHAPRVWMRTILAPACAVLAVVAALMLTYNARVTGDPLTMPYVIHEKMYGVAPLFLFQPLKPVPATLRHESMRVINARATVRDYRMQRAAIARALLTKSAVLFRAAFQQFDLTAYWLDAPHPISWPQRLLHYFLLLPLAGAFIAARRLNCAGTRFSLIALPIFAALVCLETFINPHYGAPAGGLVALVLMDGLRHLRAVGWRSRFRHPFRSPIRPPLPPNDGGSTEDTGPSANSEKQLPPSLGGRGGRIGDRNAGRRIGLTLSRIAVLLYLAAFVYHLTEFATPRWHRWIEDRRPILKFLERFPGKKLVLVYYGNDPLPLSRNQEWVYNSAGFTTQTVLWARYLTPTENTHLLTHFAEREPWVLDATDPGHLSLRRYNEFDPIIDRPKVPGTTPEAMGTVRADR